MEYYDKEFCLEIKGDFACFTRPEFKVERVSYDVITPSAARAIFEAIFWKPAIRWEVTKIEVLKPIRWTSIRRNEVNPEMKADTINSGSIYIKEGRQQRNTLLLRDVAYHIYAKLVFIPTWKRKNTKNPLIDAEEQNLLRENENPAKYNAIFERRASKGKCFTQPYLGTREFSVSSFRLIRSDTDKKFQPINEDKDLGWMFYDLDYDYESDYDTRKGRPHPSLFFPAKMKKGVIVIDKSEIRG